MIAMPLVFVMHCFQDQNRKMIFVVGCTVFMTVSIIKVIFASIALIQFENFGPVSPSISQPMDLIWVLMALTAPFLMPVPTSMDHSKN